MKRFPITCLRARSLVVLFLGAGLGLASCKKEPKQDNPSTTAYIPQNEVRDSAYLYTKDIYLWTEKLPAIETFRPRDSKDIYAVMEKVKSFEPLDHFSFVEKKSETDQGNQGLDSDFGFFVKIDKVNVDLRVNYVYSQSPAGARGVKRGWKINKINGRTIDLTKQADIDLINEVFFGSATSADFEFKKLDGSVTTLNVPKGVYALNTVLYSNVYTYGSKKIGYFVFNQFSGSTSVSALEQLMSSFQAQGVNEMIVDLRYNRGGFVSTQDVLANMLAPQSVGSGTKLMYTFQFNQKYSKWNESTYFEKTGTLNLNKIVFIVSKSTASASELLINNLRPVMEVKLIGDDATYGKPVGFFPIPVFEYNIYPVSFKTVNSVGSADYYSGFNPDKKTVDDLSHDFGDLNESCLKEALNFVNTGAFSAEAPKRIMAAGGLNETEVNIVNAKLNERIPKLEIENRPSKMPKPIRDLHRRD